MGKRVIKIIIFGIVFVAGLVIILSSITIANANVYNMMQANGGSMDTNTYLVYLEQSIINYRILGAFLAGLGSLGILIQTRNKQ